MRVLGVDFTSAPSKRKPITVSVCSSNCGELTVLKIDRVYSIDDLIAQLKSQDEWFAGLDFPFGQPRKYVLRSDWPQVWTEYVMRLGDLGKSACVEEMRRYQRDRERGDIRHFRAVDVLARSCSPMQLDFTPVARMFFVGAPALLKLECSVYPFFSLSNDRRVAIEAYPALPVRSIVGASSYKTDNKHRQSEAQKETRQAIVGALKASCDASSAIWKLYGITVTLAADVGDAMIEDGTGDTLDSVMCALQAAWAWSRRQSDFGINWECDPLEGWIADPSLYPGALT